MESSKGHLRYVGTRVRRTSHHDVAVEREAAKAGINHIAAHTGYIAPSSLR